jgi:hypothetical protein
MALVRIGWYLTLAGKINLIDGRELCTMARLTNSQKNEIVEHYYGIDPTTHEVVSVSRTRGGTLLRMGRFGSVNHPIHSSNKDNPRNEVVVVWSLTDIISFPPQFLHAEYAKRELAELKEKAAAQRKAARAHSDGEQKS